MDFDKLINKLFDILNEINNKEGYLTTVRTTNLSNELLETLKIIENCTGCKDDTGKYYLYRFHELIDKVEYLLTELEKEEQEQEKNKIIGRLNRKLIKMDDELNKKVLCESCKGKKIEKLTDKCGNEEIAGFLYQCKLNAKCHFYIQWIPLNEFKNIEYLAKGSFGEVHKATWIRYNDCKYDVVLKRIYNSSDKIADILKEVK